MSVQSHIDAISLKREQLKAAIAAEGARANPDFAIITQLKKQNLVLKEEMQHYLRQVQKSASA
jgi:hypothetical protein